jgi:hypothetical protein
MAEPGKPRVGPATRLQWGVTYLNSLIDLAPQDSAGIERRPKACWPTSKPPAPTPASNAT